MLRIGVVVRGGECGAGLTDGIAGGMPVGDGAVERLLGAGRKLVGDRTVVAHDLRHAGAVHGGGGAFGSRRGLIAVRRGNVVGQAPPYRLPLRGERGIGAVAACEIEEAGKGAVGQLLAKLVHQGADADGPSASLVVLELQGAGAAVAGEVDAGGGRSLDRLDQVFDGPEFGRGELAVLGERTSDAVALALVIQAAPLGRGDVDDQAKRPLRLPKQSAGADRAERRTGHVDAGFADQELVFSADQFPGE